MYFKCGDLNYAGIRETGRGTKSQRERKRGHQGEKERDEMRVLLFRQG